MTPKKIVSNCLAILLLACGGDLAAQNATIGNPSNPGALRQQLQDAYNSGARNITISPGTYNLPLINADVFFLNGWTNTTINAYNVTIVSAETSGRLFTLNNCTNVTLQGAYLSQTRMTAYQGKVVAVTVDANNNRLVDWQPSAGFPLPPTGASTIVCSDIDPATLFYKLRVGDFFYVPIQSLGNNTWRVQCDARPANFAVGDWLIGRFSEHPYKVLFYTSRNCTVRDLTLARNGFSTVREDGFGGGGNRVLNCRWTQGPRPPGAMVDPIVSSAADGFHSTFANPGPLVDGCRFEGIFHDDPIAIHGAFQTVLSASGNTLTVSNGYAYLTAGQPARLYDQAGFHVSGTVTSVLDKGNGTSLVTLDQNYSVPANAKIVNPLSCGAGYQITNNYIQGTRSRGILAKGDNGYIANNIIENCDMAIQLGPEYYWNEADYVHGTLIVNNVFRNIGYIGYGNPTVLVRGDGALANSSNDILSNEFISCYGKNIRVEYNAGSSIRDNTFTAPARYPTGFGLATVATLNYDNGVEFLNNKLSNSANYSSPRVVIGTNVTNVTGAVDSNFATDKLINGDFEQQNSYTQTVGGWTEWGGPSGQDQNASFVESYNGAYSGSFHATHWRATAYTVGTDQVVGGLANGTYLLRAHVKGSVHVGGVAQMEAHDYGGAKLTVAIPQSTKWIPIQIPNIQVTNGQCVVTFFSIARANEWIYFDNVQLVLQ